MSAVPLFAAAGLAPQPLVALLTGWLVRQGQPATTLHGAVTGDPLGEWLRRGSLPVSLDAAYDSLATLTSQVRRDGFRLRTLGVEAGAWAEAGANAVQELAFGLATGTAYLRALDQRGLGVDVSAPRVLFTYALGSNLFMEIAKLRAARLIWARAVQAAGEPLDERPGVDDRRAHGRHPLVRHVAEAEHESVIETRELGRRELAADAHQVFLLDLAVVADQFFGNTAVLGKHQQAGRVDVEPTSRRQSAQVAPVESHVIAAAAMKPPLSTRLGLTPKKAGFHSTRSAHLPTSTEPTSCARPLASAGLMVYLAT